jgi:hypothetical protein
LCFYHELYSRRNFTKTLESGFKGFDKSTFKSHQSSQWGDHPSGFGIDNDYTTYFHTDGPYEGYDYLGSWWGISMPTNNQDIRRISIIARKDGYFDRLRGYIVRLCNFSSIPPNGPDINHAVSCLTNKDNVLVWESGPIENARFKKMIHSLLPGTQANYLNVQLPQGRSPYLHLSSVSLGYFESEFDKSTFKSHQSSQWYDHPSDYGIDNNKATYFHTDGPFPDYPELGSWWAIGMMSTNNFDVRKISITPRQDCCFDRLNGYVVHLCNFKSMSPSGPHISNAVSCLTNKDDVMVWKSEYDDNANLQLTQWHYLSPGLKGNYVIIQIPEGRSPYLHLSDVTVYY